MKLIIFYFPPENLSNKLRILMVTHNIFYGCCMRQIEYYPLSKLPYLPYNFQLKNMFDRVIFSARCCSKIVVSCEHKFIFCMLWSHFLGAETSSAKLFSFLHRNECASAQVFNSHSHTTCSNTSHYWRCLMTVFASLTVHSRPIAYIIQHAFKEFQSQEIKCNWLE